MMTETARLRPLCQALDVSHPRAEAMISRGHVKMSQDVVPGQARRLNVFDGFVLELALTLSDLSVPPNVVESANLEMRFVAHAGRPEIAGKFLVFRHLDPKKGDFENVRANFPLPDNIPRDAAPLVAKVLPEAEVIEELPGRPSIVVPLEPVLHRVEAAFASLAEEK